MIYLFYGGGREPPESTKETVTMSGEERGILESLVEALSMYNQRDMLGGYLNPLADEFNQRLESLELPTIELVADEDGEY